MASSNDAVLGDLRAIASARVAGLVLTEVLRLVGPILEKRRFVPPRQLGQIRSATSQR